MSLGLRSFVRPMTFNPHCLFRSSWSWFRYPSIFDIYIPAVALPPPSHSFLSSWNLSFTYCMLYSTCDLHVKSHSSPGPPRGGGAGGKCPGARRLLGARQGPTVNIVNLRKYIYWARNCSIWEGPWPLCPWARIFTRWPCSSHPLFFRLHFIYSHWWKMFFILISRNVALYDKNWYNHIILVDLVFLDFIS